MSVRCKMIVQSVHDSWDGYHKRQGASTVRLNVVSGDENKSWSQWTPCGHIELQINNPEAFKQFQLGKEFFVDFTACEGPESAPATEEK